MLRALSTRVSILGLATTKRISYEREPGSRHKSVCIQTHFVLAFINKIDGPYDWGFTIVTKAYLYDRRIFTRRRIEVPGVEETVLRRQYISPFDDIRLTPPCRWCDVWSGVGSAGAGVAAAGWGSRGVCSVCSNDSSCFSS
jgi:hypothetical protein